MDPDTIELGWLNEEDIVTDDSRVTIIDSFADPSNDSSNFTVNMITTVIQFDPLFEEDEGNYSCYAIVNETERSTSIQLQNFRSTYFIGYIMHTCIHMHTIGTIL